MELSRVKLESQIDAQIQDQIVFPETAEDTRQHSPLQQSQTRELNDYRFDLESEDDSQVEEFSRNHLKEEISRFLLSMHQQSVSQRKPQEGAPASPAQPIEKGLSDAEPDSPSKQKQVSSRCIEGGLEPSWPECAGLTGEPLDVPIDFEGSAQYPQLVMQLS